MLFETEHKRGRGPGAIPYDVPSHNITNLGKNLLDLLPPFELVSNDGGGNPRPRHGRGSSHNIAVLPQLPVGI
ncbi:hypothetical protein TNCV_4526941 [Trichonephila clavipes]|nr:hypothetical protein TNCV_4526941 [Trichonephila clavipes]